MSKSAKKIAYNIVYAVCVIGISLAVWSIAALAIGSEFVLPNVEQTFVALKGVLKMSVFWRALGGTLARSAIGFGISLVLFGVTFFFATAFEPFRRIIEPIISALRAMPAVAITLVLAIVLGGYGTPIVMGVLVIMPIMYSAARARTSSVQRELKEICRLNGAGKLQTFKALWFPCLAGGLPESMATSFSYNIKAVIGAEVLAQTSKSLGMLMKQAQAYFETAMLIAFVLAAVVVAVIFEFAIKWMLSLVFRKYVD
ncbi:MAG: ABC transporter permease subunit [Clostridiales bacterium]|nr:ABC transporter permease subunit [Clostridiales bacterium]